MNRPCQPGIEHHDADAGQVSCYTKAAPPSTHVAVYCSSVSVAREDRSLRTDLIQPTLLGKDGNVSVESRAA